MTQYVDITIKVTILFKKKQEFIVEKTGIPRQVLFIKAMEAYLARQEKTIDPSYGDKRRKKPGHQPKIASVQYKVPTEVYLFVEAFVEDWNEKYKAPLFYIKQSDVYTYALDTYFDTIIERYQLIE